MSFKEHNNREVSKKLAEYITGTELRKYVAKKVKQYVNLENPTVFDGAVGSGQLEQFVEPSMLYGVDVYDKAVGEKVKRLSRLDFEHIPINIPLVERQDKIIDNFIKVRKKFENNFELLEKAIDLSNKYVNFGVDGLLKLK